MPKNYYIILGIPSDSTQEDIKSAYRRLAKKFHPDFYGKDQAPFQIIQEAYTVLGNPRSRKDYDISLKPSIKQVSVPTNSEPLHQYREQNIEPLIHEDETTAIPVLGDNVPFKSNFTTITPLRRDIT